MITGIMTEQRHQCLQRHAGIRQGGGVGVAQLMWDDAQRLAVGPGQASV